MLGTSQNFDLCPYTKLPSKIVQNQHVQHQIYGIAAVIITQINYISTQYGLKLIL